MFQPHYLYLCYPVCRPWRPFGIVDARVQLMARAGGRVTPVVLTPRNVLVLILKKSKWSQEPVSTQRCEEKSLLGIEPRSSKSRRRSIRRVTRWSLVTSRAECQLTRKLLRNTWLYEYLKPWQWQSIENDDVSELFLSPLLKWIISQHLCLRGTSIFPKSEHLLDF